MPAVDGECVYELLRDEIITARLAPGAPLPLSQLAEQFGVSTMPIRVALVRLETEGFVVLSRHRGAIVAPLLLEELEEIQAIRAGIEGFAARLGAERMTPESLRCMESLLEDVRSRAQQRVSLDSYISFQWRLHAVCYAASGRERLLNLVDDYQRRSARYVRLAIGSDTGFDESIAFQERFYDACQRRDAREAERVIRQALAWTVERLAPIVKQEESFSTTRPSTLDRQLAQFGNLELPRFR